jgi:hypothetical protein
MTAPFPDDVRHFVESTAWTFAKTYAATWPHEYVVENPENSEMIFAVARHIFEHGTEGRFYSQIRKYHHEGGKVYWSMDDTPEETGLINRCSEAQTYEARLAAGTLPKEQSPLSKGRPTGAGAGDVVAFEAPPLSADDSLIGRSAVMRYEGVRFQWFGPDEHTGLTGQVLTRRGEAGPEMVLDVADPDGDGPYLIVGRVPAGKTYFAGINSGRNRRNEVAATWASVGTGFVGRWIEGRIEYLFSFAIPNEEDEQK